MKRKPAELNLIEKMRWEPQNGFLRLDQHIRRLSRSADALGFRMNQDPVHNLNMSITGEHPLTVTLIMNYKGELDIQTEPFIAVESNTPWKLKLATKTKLSSADTFYRHKSSRREPYEAARAEYSIKEADEVILMNEKDEICEGTQTSIFVLQDDGSMLTPPLNSGILSGVLRADLIRNGKVRGQVITHEDLMGKKLYIGNSRLGLIAAQLI